MDEGIWVASEKQHTEEKVVRSVRRGAIYPWGVQRGKEFMGGAYEGGFKYKLITLKSANGSS